MTAGALSTPATKKRARRTRELARIHLLRRDLGLDETRYRDVVQAVTGHRSAGDLDQALRSRLLEHLVALASSAPPAHHLQGRLGEARPPRARGLKGAYPGRPHSCDSNPQLQKIEALLADNDLPWAYADSIARRMYHRDRLTLCSPPQLSGVIAALVGQYGDRTDARPGRVE